MKAENEFDIAVLGAGITGLGVALEACRQGKRVCLIDQSDCGLATSNNSLRIIHGGLRYLQKFDFPRIVASVADQSYCLKKWPDLVKPLRCVAPLSGHGLKRANLARIASLLYSCFLGALSSPLERPYVDPRNNFEGLAFLTGLAPHGFLVWQDALLLDHQALVQSMLKEITDLGGKVFEHSRIIGIEDAGSVVKISYEDSAQLQKSISANKAVNCLGARLGQLANPVETKWCLAFNVILKKQFSPDLAFGCDGEQGRTFFFVPRDNRTVIGTEYLPFTDSPDRALPSRTDIESFIESAGRAVPQLKLSLEDIEAVESGVLPMKELNSKGQPVLFGASQIKAIGNVVHVLSTKYTTFHSQALEILKSLE